MRTSFRSTGGRQHGILSLLVACALLIGSLSTAQAALTTGGCLAQKRKAWSNLRKCQGTEEAKQLQGKTADLAKCQTKFDEKLGKISDKAAASAVACRYGDNGDGTVTDYDTGLHWEKKDSLDGGANLANPHDADNMYSWNTSLGGTTPNGTAFTDFLDKLNNCVDDGIFPPTGVTGGFAGHCDWRLPSIVELEAIVDLTASGCGGGSPCIVPSFGPTATGYYRSATTVAGILDRAWNVGFGSGNVNFIEKFYDAHVRAVRTGL